MPSHGFTPEALALGARDIGLLDISPAVLPDGGAFALIRWHLYFQRTCLAGKVHDVFAGEGEGGAPRTVGERVEALAWARLRGNEGVVGRWQEVSFVSHSPTTHPPL